MKLKGIHSGQSGITVIEAVVSIVVLSIVAVAITSNLFVALRTAKTTEVNHAVSTLASSKMEELSAISAIDLNPSFSGVEANVTWPDLNFTFTRTTVVTINSDQSRSATVTVSSNHPSLKSTVSFKTNFALWE